MHDQESVQDTHKLPWDFDHLILARQPDIVIVNKRKRTCRIIDFAVQADHRIKLKASEKRDKYLDFGREMKNGGIWKWQWYQL